MNLESLTTIEKRVLAESNETDTQVLQSLAVDKNSYVRKAALENLRHKSTLKELPDDWQQLSKEDCINRIHEGLADADILQILVHSESRQIRKAIAYNDKTPEYLLVALEKDEDRDVRQAVLDRDLPPDWRAYSTLERIERLSAAAEDISIEILDALARSDKWRLRVAVACHENTPDHLLALLARDEYPDVRMAVADRHLPQEWRHLDEEECIEKLSTTTVESEVAEILSHSDSWRIREQLARNPGATETILVRLSEDEDWDVCEAARDGLLYRRLPEEWRQIGDKKRIQKLESQSVPVDILQILAAAKNWNVRQAVARHDATPSSLIEQLSQDDSSDVRQAATLDRLLPSEWRYLNTKMRLRRLAEEKVSLEILKALALATDWRLRQAVANCLSTSEDLLKKLAEDSDSDVASAAREAILSRRLPSEWVSLDDDKRIKRVKRGDASSETLETLALSSSQQMRCAVASCLSTPIRSLHRLSEDKDDEVRRIAKQTLIRRLLPNDWMKLNETQLIERIHREPVQIEVLQALAMSDSLSTRDAVASNICATIPILLSMKDDASTPKRIRNLLRKTWAIPQQNACYYANDA